MHSQSRAGPGPERLGFLARKAGLPAGRQVAQTHAGQQEAECGGAVCPAEGGQGGRDPETTAGGPFQREASFPRGRTRKRAAGSAGARAAGASRGRGGWGGEGCGAVSPPGHAPSGGGGDCAVHGPPLRTEVRAASGGRVLLQGPGSGSRPQDPPRAARTDAGRIIRVLAWATGPTW